MAAPTPLSVPDREALRAFARSARQPAATGGAAGAGCVVSVGAYTRSRNGKTEQVGAYRRNNPNCAEGAEPGVIPVADRRPHHAAPQPAQQSRPPAAPLRAWIGQPNQTWREQIAAEESRRSDGDFGYGLRGPAGGTALGRYQILLDPLIDADWRDRRSPHGWTARARREGVASDADFLARPAAQEAALNEVMRRNEEQLVAYGVMRFLGRQMPGLRGDPVPITESGLAAAAHRQGAKTVRDDLLHRAANLPPPPSVDGRGDLSKFNEVERRLRAFAATPYQSVRR